MSQKKVDQYKEYKKNRSKILKREKRVRKIEYGVIIAICCAFVAWFGWSIYSNVKTSNDAKTAQAEAAVTTIDMNAYQDYIGTLPSGFST